MTRSREPRIASRQEPARRWLPLWLVWAACVMPVGQAVSQTLGACPEGSLLESTSGECAPTRDRRANVIREEVDPPSLTELRAGAAHPALPRIATRPGESPLVPGPRATTVVEPPPGGIGAGTTYLPGTLQALREGVLQTDMTIYPEGYGPTTPGMDWLYTTATNRVEKGVEVVALYYRQTAYGRLGVFDWSCSPEDPCENGATEPSWIWTSNFRNFSCNTGEFVDPGGHLQKVIRYSNKSRIVAGGTPPRWENAVYLWNFCETGWDRVYRHRYRAAQRDCSAGGYECAWWGPIIETFRNFDYPVPEMKELGFARTTLRHDGMLSRLRPDEARFDFPNRPWLMFHLEPYSEFGAGNFVMDTRLVNGQLRVVIKPGSHRYTENSPACPAGFAGEYAFTARVRNQGKDPLGNLIIEVERLAGRHQVLADGSYLGSGQWFNVPRRRGYRDGVLMRGESVPVPFRVCLRKKEPFSLDIHVRTR